MVDVKVRIGLNKVSGNTEDYLEVNAFSGLKSVESLSQSTGQPREIEFGVISSSGDIEIVDTNNKIANMITNGVMPTSNLDITILIGDNIIQKHKSENATYSLHDKKFSISLTNILTNLEKIQVKSSKFDNTYTKMKNIVDYIIDKSNIDKSLIANLYNTRLKYGLTSSEKEGTVADYLNEISVNWEYEYLEESNILDILNELCNFLQLNLYLNDNNSIVFESGRPRILSTDKIIVIPSSKQFSALDPDFIVENKYNNVRYIEKKLDKSREDEETSFSFRNSEGKIDFQSMKGYDLRLIAEEYIDGDAIYGSYDVRQYYSEPSSFNTNRYDYSFGFFDELKLGNPIIRVNTYKLLPLDKDGNGDQTYNHWRNIDSEAWGKEDFDIYAHTHDTDVNKFILFSDIGGRGFDPYSSGLIRLSQYASANSETFVIKAPTNFYSGNIDAYKINLYINYDKYTISEKEITLNNNSNVFESKFDGTILNSDVKLNGKSLYEIIADNIINDYSEGIRTLNISVACSNYYDINGGLIKDWETNHEIFKVGDIVRVDKDNFGNSAITYSDNTPMYFKVTGRTFKKQGVPMIDLELREVK